MLAGGEENGSWLLYGAAIGACLLDLVLGSALMGILDSFLDVSLGKILGGEATGPDGETEVLVCSTGGCN